MLATESSRTRDSAVRPQNGFSLIELLAACSIMVIIAMIVAQFFHKASLAWDVGYKKSEAVMRGRGVVSAIIQDLQLAVPNDPSAEPSSIESTAAKFWILANPKDGQAAIRLIEYTLRSNEIWRRVTYRSGLVEEYPLADGISSLQFSPPSPSGSLPLAVLVSVTVTNQRQFEAQAYIMNHNYQRL